MKQKVLFISHFERACGVHQFGEFIFRAIADSNVFDFQYVEVATVDELFEVVDRERPSALIVNSHDATLPLIPWSAFWDTGLPLLGVIHETTDELARTSTNTRFDLYIDHNPVGTTSNPNYLHSVRPVPEYQNTFEPPAIPTIGSFGFATPSKDYERIVALAQDEFDECIIRLSIPYADFGDREGTAAREVAARCAEIVTKPGVKLEVNHDFLPVTGVLDFLAQNSINVFIYKEETGRGISSAMDLALAVDRPIAVGKTSMFRHCAGLEPSIFVGDLSIREIMNNGIAPLEPLKSHWTLNQIKLDYEAAIERLLEITREQRSQAHGDQLRRRAAGVVADNPPPTLRSPFNNPLVVSYAGSNEDLRLLRAFADEPVGTYIDVGAGDPVVGSVTKLLYDRGWSGVNVEPGPPFDELDKARPRDVNLKLAVSDVDGYVEFHNFEHGWPSSTIVSDRKVYFGTEEDWTVERIPAATLTSIIDEHLPGREVDVLKVDAEGAEAQVLISNDWSRHRPRVVVVEATMPWSALPAYADWEYILLENDYLFAAFDGINRFYVRSDQSRLINALDYPVGLLDRYKSYDQFLGEWRELELTWKNESMRKELAWKQEQLAHAKAKNRQLRRRNRVLERRLGSRARRFGGRVKRKVGRTLRAKPVKPTKATPAARQNAVPTGAVPKWFGEHAFSASTAIVTSDDLVAFAQRLNDPSTDSESNLSARLDSHGDRIGLALSDARAMRALAESPPLPQSQAGVTAEKPYLLFDARGLQDHRFRGRGVGSFTCAALDAAAAAVEPEFLLLLVSADQPDLEAALAELGTPIPHVPEDLEQVGLFIQPSPMTNSLGPILPVLMSSVSKFAVVYDFIPSEHPDRYLNSPIDQVTNRARLVALSRYDGYSCISGSTESRLAARGLDPTRAWVSWPERILGPCEDPVDIRTTPGETRIVIPGGRDERKNLAGALGACAGIVNADPTASIVVLGHYGDEAGVFRLGMAAKIPPARITVAPRVSDDDLIRIVRSARAVVVPSFAEGLSLPPIEAVRAGVPVVASDIDVHREVLGAGDFLADPDDDDALRNALQFVVANGPAVAAQQSEALLAHEHRSLEEAVQTEIAHHTTRGADNPSTINRSVGHLRGARPNIGIGTPWPPHASGVADYSRFTLSALADRCDLTVYSTGEAVGRDPFVTGVGEIAGARRRHDSFLSVIGNSHFHLPYLEELIDSGGAALCHDTRMLESYRALRGAQGLAELLARNPATPTITAADVNYLIEHLDLVTDRGFREIAIAADPLIFHSESTALDVAEQSGRPTKSIPFVPYNLPTESTITAADRAAARNRLGFGDKANRIVVLGGIDSRTKATDLTIEAVAWLRQWGIDTQLYFVGDGNPGEIKKLNATALGAGIPEAVHVTNRVDSRTYADYLLGADLGLQIRSSKVLSLSGAAADMAAYGMPGLASEPLVIDHQLPSFVAAVPLALSPLRLAEAIATALDSPTAADEVEDQRRGYLESHSLKAYSDALLEALGFDA